MSFPRYEKYKESGIEWLGEVPEHWNIQPLKNLVSTPITDGPHETPDFLDEGVPFVSAEAVSEGRLDFAKIRAFISLADHERYAKKYLPQRNDIFMVKSGATTGVTAIVDTDKEFNIWSPLAAIRCNSSVEPRFMLNYLRSINFLDAISLNWSFGTQQNIGMGIIENLAALLPPIKEQIEIATMLDSETAKINALIEEQQRLITLLKEKRQAVISHAVTKGLNPAAPMKDSGFDLLPRIPQTWKMLPLKRVSSAIVVGIVVNPSTYTTDEGLPFIFGGDIREGMIDSLNCRRISQIDSLANKKTQLNTGDILTVRVGAPGVTAVVPKECEGGNCASVMLTRRGAFHSEWLCFAFNSRFVRFQVEVVQYGAAQEQFNIGHAVNFIFPVPPREEQTEIADELREQTGAIDELVRNAQSAIALLQERLSALISAAVTGKIDVRNYSPREKSSHEEVYEPA